MMLFAKFGWNCFDGSEKEFANVKKVYKRTDRETNIQTDRQTDAEQKVIGKAQLTFQSGELRKRVPDLCHQLQYMYYVSFLF